MNTTVAFNEHVMSMIREPPQHLEPSGLERGVNFQSQPLMDVAKAAFYLGCSVRFIRRLVQERRIPFVKLGGTRVRFLARDLDRWVESQRVEAMR